MYEIVIYQLGILFSNIYKEAFPKKSKIILN